MKRKLLFLAFLALLVAPAFGVGEEEILALRGEAEKLKGAKLPDAVAGLYGNEVILVYLEGRFVGCVETSEGYVVAAYDEELANYTLSVRVRNLEQVTGAFVGAALSGEEGEMVQAFNQQKANGNIRIEARSFFGGIKLFITDIGLALAGFFGI